VGSEMCIRDRGWSNLPPNKRRFVTSFEAEERIREDGPRQKSKKAFTGDKPLRGKL